MDEAGGGGDERSEAEGDESHLRMTEGRKLLGAPQHDAGQALDRHDGGQGGHRGPDAAKGRDQDEVQRDVRQKKEAVGDDRPSGAAHHQQQHAAEPVGDQRELCGRQQDEHRIGCLVLAEQAKKLFAERDHRQ